MITASELAGMFAAHAIWCVSDGDVLVPMLAHSDESDERQMERLIVDDDLEKSVAYGRQKLDDNPMDANNAVFLFDGTITIEGVVCDAVIIEVRSYFSPQSRFVLAVPYTPATAGHFLVHKPKVLVWENCEDLEIDAALEAFFVGVNQHEKGAEIWANSLDESR